MSGPLVLECDQRSDAWQEARLGIPTASQFGRIVTPTGKLSTSRGGYMDELLAEWATGRPPEFHGSFWTERGMELEPEARAFYEMFRDVEARTVGFVFKDEARQVGCSPDWLVGDSGGCEVKCPKVDTHLRYLREGVIPSQYVPQVQGCLWVTGRSWWDFLSYCPGLPPLLVRCDPDAEYQARLDEFIPTFLEDLEAQRAVLRAAGVHAPPTFGPAEEV